MSYGLAVWEGDRPLDDDQAGSTYDELYERYLESDDVAAPPVPRIRAYVEALVERYPDDVAHSVWASPPVIEEASGPMVACPALSRFHSGSPVGRPWSSRELKDPPRAGPLHPRPPPRTS